LLAATTRLWRERDRERLAVDPKDANPNKR